MSPITSQLVKVVSINRSKANFNVKFLMLFEFCLLVKKIFIKIKVPKKRNFVVTEFSEMFIILKVGIAASCETNLTT